MAMEYRPLEITVISGEGLKNFNFFMRMGVYVVISIIQGNNRIFKGKTHVAHGGSNPKWSQRMKFSIVEPNISESTLLFVLRSSRLLGDRDIGEVSIPIRELFEGSTNIVETSAEQVVTYQVRTVSGKPKGSFTFSYKFGEKVNQSTESVAPNRLSKADASVKAAGTSVPYQANPGMMYQMSPPGMPYPPPQGYGGYPPPPQYGNGYGGWYPPPGHPGAYPYPPPQQMGYGYQTVQQPMPQKKGGGGSKLALGMGAGLIGGLLVGDMISDVGEMAAYDAGYSAGLDDGVDLEL